MKTSSSVEKLNGNSSIEATEKPLTCLEFFAGAGGLALGTHQAGFKHIGFIEKDKAAVDTLRHNIRSFMGLSTDLVFGADARDMNYKDYYGKVDLLAGGPPCQPFSNAGRCQGDMDERNMFPVFLDAIAATHPKAVMVENVKGLRRESFREYFDYIIKRMEFPFVSIRERESWRDHFVRLSQARREDFDAKETYVVSWQLVNSADYGVPQQRERVLLFAFRSDLNVAPFHVAATYSKNALLIDQWITRNYWERHGIEPVDYLGRKDKKQVENLSSNLPLPDGTLAWRTARDVLRDLPPPVTRGHEPELINHVQHPGARAYRCHTGSPWDFPAKALKAGTHGTPGGENMLREGDTVRYFTTREAARLQTFPDEWLFEGTWGACIRQLGNAVPVEMARIFARTIYDRLRENREI